jgi:tripartite ATP-independent transporter DctP family solute receptor
MKGRIMKTQRSLLALTILGLAHTLISPPPAAADEIEKRVIRFAICVPSEHPLAHGARKLSEVAAARSDGKLNVKVYDNCTLGSDSQTIAALRGGTLQMAGPSTTPIATIAKELGMFDLPYVFATSAEADTVLDGPVGTALLDKLPEKSLIGLAYLENGFRNTTNSRRPINTADDYKGLKIRVQQNAVFIDTFNTLGANAVPLPQTEVYTALETGAIDAYEGAVVNILTFKFQEIQKHLTLDRHAYTPFVILVAKKLWDDLSPQEQAILREAAIEARDHQRKVSREMEKTAVDELKRDGMEVTELPAAEVEKMRERVRPVIQKHKQEIGAEFVDAMYAAVAKVRGQ